MVSAVRSVRSEQRLEWVIVVWRGLPLYGKVARSRGPRTASVPIPSRLLAVVAGSSVHPVCAPLTDQSLSAPATGSARLRRVRSCMRPRIFPEAGHVAHSPSSALLRRFGFLPLYKIQEKGEQPSLSPCTATHSSPGHLTSTSPLKPLQLTQARSHSVRLPCLSLLVVA